MEHHGHLLIFDLDGLLVDTEKLFYQAFKIVAKRHNQNPSFAEYVEKVMSFGHEVSKLIKGPEDQEDRIKRQVYEEYRKQLERGVSLRPGALNCLRRLSHYPCVLVTGSKREYADMILNRCGLMEFFEEVITRDDGFAPKPSPAIFQHVLTQYHKSPKNCLVIEDSKRGVSAAIHLGIPCVFIPNEYTHDQSVDEGVTRMRSLDDLTVAKVEQILSDAPLKLDQTLVNLYRDNISRLTDIFERYRSIYGLDEHVHVDKKVTPVAFEYAKKRSFFVILVMSTKDGRSYFQRSFDTGHLSMILLGSGVRLEKDDTMLGVINRLACRVLKDARLADIAPLVFLRNRFECVDGRVVEHIGLGVRALLLNDVSEVAAYEADAAVKGSFIKGFPVEEIPQNPAAEVYRRYLNWRETRDYATYVNEIETQHDVFWRYQFHQGVVNPILRAASLVLGDHSIRDVKRAVLDRIGPASTCIDVACGDDRAVFDVLRKVPFVVANDISVDQMEQMEREYNRQRHSFPKAHAMMFTNHDCMDLPFRDGAFDVAICRNLLHHMSTAQDLKALLDNMRRVAKRLLLIEIRDPNTEGAWSKLRHRYYMDFLKDEGRHFYDSPDFENVMTQHFGSGIEFSQYGTIRGTYMIAEIGG